MVRGCGICKYRDVYYKNEPCKSCRLSGGDHVNFEPKERKNIMKNSYKCGKCVNAGHPTHIVGGIPVSICTMCDGEKYFEEGVYKLVADDGMSTIEVNVNQPIPNYVARPLMPMPVIMNVIFNDPATIVFWSDGTKTVVKAIEEKFDPEKGLAMAISKKHMGNNYEYYNTFKRWLKVYDKKVVNK